MSTDNALTSSFTICPLQKSHARRDFDCGVESLNNFLRNNARQNASRFHSRTFIAFRQDDQKTIAGYYTLTLNTKRFDEAPTEYHVPADGSVPVALLARLAVDRRFQGRGIGEQLLLDALRRCSEIANQAGCCAVEVEAIDDKAAAFYRKYGFTVIDEREPYRLYMAMTTVIKLFAQ